MASGSDNAGLRANRTANAAATFGDATDVPTTLLWSGYMSGTGFPSAPMSGGRTKTPSAATKTSEPTLDDAAFLLGFVVASARATTSTLSNCAWLPSRSRWSFPAETTNTTPCLPSRATQSGGRTCSTASTSNPPRLRFTTKMVSGDFATERSSSSRLAGSTRPVESFRNSGDRRSTVSPAPSARSICSA